MHPHQMTASIRTTERPACNECSPKFSHAEQMHRLVRVVSRQIQSDMPPERYDERPALGPSENAVLETVAVRQRLQAPSCRSRSFASSRGRRFNSVFNDFRTPSGIWNRPVATSRCAPPAGVPHTGFCQAWTAKFQSVRASRIALVAHFQSQPFSVDTLASHSTPVTGKR